MAMLVDEYPDLVPGQDAEDVANNTRMLEAFILDKTEQGEIKFNFDQKTRKVLYHGHCQQKAVFGTENTLKLLQLIPNCTVEQVDSGCCGMAGSFGYEHEHFDLSIQLAEMSLAPAVRNADPDVLICASGTSCREQIHYTTHRAAKHPIEIFADALI
jgi:Fe-S oxidoreductase